MRALNRYLGLGLILFVSESVFAVSGGKQYFETELEAVQAAASRYNPISIREDREYMGAIYRSGDYFTYTVTAGEVGANRVGLSIPTDQWDSVVALWHTHGDASPLHQYFSHIDTRLVREHGKPLYLADFTGQLKVFSPGDRKLTRRAAERLGLPANWGYARGTVVANVNGIQTEVAVRGLEPTRFESLD